MRRLNLTLAGIALVALAAATPEDDFRYQAKAMNAKYERAMLKKDIKTFSKLFMANSTKDFKHIENGQSMNAKQMLDMMKTSVGQFQKVTKFKSRLLTVQVQGDKANVTASNEMAGTMTGPDKKKHTMSFKGNTEEKYVKIGKTWKIASMEWKTMDMLMDGKKMDPAAMAPPANKKG